MLRAKSVFGHKLDESRNRETRGRHVFSFLIALDKKRCIGYVYIRGCHFSLSMTLLLCRCRRRFVYINGKRAKLRNTRNGAGFPTVTGSAGEANICGGWEKNYRGLHEFFGQQIKAMMQLEKKKRGNNGRKKETWKIETKTPDTVTKLKEQPSQISTGLDTKSLCDSRATKFRNLSVAAIFLCLPAD